MEGNYFTIAGGQGAEGSAHCHPASGAGAGNVRPGHLTLGLCDLSLLSSTQHNARQRAGVNKYLSNVK